MLIVYIPSAMCNLIPTTPDKYHKNINNLNNFFGFLEAEITCPKNLTIPTLLPYKDEILGTIYPTGK
jgi:hypothetical protein